MPQRSGASARPLRRVNELGSERGSGQEGHDPYREVQQNLLAHLLHPRQRKQHWRNVVENHDLDDVVEKPPDEADDGRVDKVTEPNLGLGELADASATRDGLAGTLHH